MIKPKGARLLVEEIEKENKNDVTESGIILEAKDKDSHDVALIQGLVLEVGTPEIIKGELIKPDLEIGTKIWFNRYEAYIVLHKGLSTYWLVNCKDVWGVGDFE